MTLAHNVQFRPFHLMSFRMNTKMKISPRPQASPRPPPTLVLEFLEKLLSQARSGQAAWLALN